MNIIQCLSVLLFLVSIHFSCGSISAQSDCCSAPIEATDVDPNEESKRRTEALIRLTCVFESDCYEVVELKPLWQDFQRNVSFSDRMERTSFDNRGDSLYYLISEIDAYVNDLKSTFYKSGNDRGLNVEENLQANLFSVVMKEARRIEEINEVVTKQKVNTIGIIFAHASLDSTRKHLAEIDRFAANGIFKLSALAIVIDNMFLESTGTTLYGTKFDPRQDPVYFYPVIDEAHLAQRRKNFGLQPFEHYKKMAIEFNRTNALGH